MTPNTISGDDCPEVRFRYLADYQKGCLPSSEIELHPDAERAPYLTMEYLRGETVEPNLVPVDSSVLMASEKSILLLWDGSNAGEFLRAKQGVVSSTSALVTPKSVDPAYFYWACKGQEDRVRAETVGMGIPHVNGNFLANIRIRLPSLPQQCAIAEHLDRETTRLDALIAAKERLITLLSEKRQALITNAVTRDCGSNELKVPPTCRTLLTEGSQNGSAAGRDRVHTLATRSDGVTEPATSLFPTKRLKHVVSLRRSRADGSENGRPYVGLENINSWTGSLLGDLSTSTNLEGTSLSHTFEPGDVLFGKLRPYLAKVWVAKFAGRSTTECLVMKPVEIEARFLGYVCVSRYFIDAVDASAFGSKMPRADWNFIGNMVVPVPERLKQLTIADYLDRETARMDSLVAEIKVTISLLKERRAALIATAVSSQFDIGEAA